jgi:lipoprotein-anchoring transpeptidase ErfK/SrfK
MVSANTVELIYRNVLSRTHAFAPLSRPRRRQSTVRPLHSWVGMKFLLTFWLAFATVALAQPPTARPQGGAARPPATKGTTGAPVVSETLALQVMLDRAGFSPGEIDGRAGANMKRAIAAFQRGQGLPESGQADQATWERLAQHGSQQTPLMTYEITAADVQGPFERTIPADLMEQSKLQALTYTSGLEALAEKFHASPRLLQQLNTGATFSSAGERIMVPNVEPFDVPAPAAQEPQRRGSARGTAARGAAAGRGGAARGPEPARGAARGTDSTRGGAVSTAPDEPAVTIAVTKSTSSLTVEDESGRVIFHAPVTSGTEHDPLPIGTWKVTTIHTMPVFNYNPELFWDADPSHSKARIPRGPNNPVGVAWIDLSKEHYGIHGTPEPSRIGHVQSHGCVRMTNWDVVRVMQWIRPGVTVVFRE